MTLVSYEPAERSLESLAEIANRENQLATDAASQSLLHAILAGEALIEAQSKVQLGQWYEWLDENFKASRVWASVLMRIAYYRDHLGEADNVTAARATIKGLPPIGLTGSSNTAWDLRNEARNLSARGLKQVEIAELMGKSERQVWAYLNPSAHRVIERRSARKAAAARAALRRQERNAAVKKRGGTTAHAFEHVLKALEALERALSEDQPTEAKAALNEAVRCGHKMEDAIGEAVRLYAK